MSEGERMKVAITGSIGSGKSSVGAYLRSKSFEVIDTDKLVHDFYRSSLYDAVVDVFGINILDPSGAIDRTKLGALVFENPLALNDLESIVFPAVSEYIMSINDRALVFFEVPMLFESNMEDLFDSILMIDADQSLALERLVLRGISREEALKRLAFQMNPQEKSKRSHDVIVNNGSLNDLYNLVDLYLVEKGWNK